MHSFAALWIYAGMLTHLMKVHDAVPLIMKIISVALFLGSVITLHFVYYDRSVRKRAPTETGAGVETVANEMVADKGGDVDGDFGSV